MGTMAVDKIEKFVGLVIPRDFRLEATNMEGTWLWRAFDKICSPLMICLHHMPQTQALNNRPGPSKTSPPTFSRPLEMAEHVIRTVSNLLGLDFGKFSAQKLVKGNLSEVDIILKALCGIIDVYHAKTNSPLRPFSKDRRSKPSVLYSPRTKRLKLQSQQLRSTGHVTKARTESSTRKTVPGKYYPTSAPSPNLTAADKATLSAAAETVRKDKAKVRQTVRKTSERVKFYTAIIDNDLADSPGKRRRSILRQGQQRLRDRSLHHDERRLRHKVQEAGNERQRKLVAEVLRSDDQDFMEQREHLRAKQKQRSDFLRELHRDLQTDRQVRYATLAARTQRILDDQRHARLSGRQELADLKSVERNLSQQQAENYHEALRELNVKIDEFCS